MLTSEIQKQCVATVGFTQQATHCMFHFGKINIFVKYNPTKKLNSFVLFVPQPPLLSDPLSNIWDSLHTNVATSFHGLVYRKSILSKVVFR